MELKTRILKNGYLHNYGFNKFLAFFLRIEKDLLYKLISNKRKIIQIIFQIKKGQLFSNGLICLGVF